MNNKNEDNFIRVTSPQVAELRRMIQTPELSLHEQLTYVYLAYHCIYGYFPEFKDNREFMKFDFKNEDLSYKTDKDIDDFFFVLDKLFRPIITPFQKKSLKCCIERIHCHDANRYHFHNIYCEIMASAADEKRQNRMSTCYTNIRHKFLRDMPFEVRKDVDYLFRFCIHDANTLLSDETRKTIASLSLPNAIEYATRIVEPDYLYEYQESRIKIRKITSKFDEVYPRHDGFHRALYNLAYTVLFDLG